MSEPQIIQPISNNDSLTPFVFKKNNSDLFVLYLKTILLSVITLGIYSFWGRVAITKYLYSHISIGGRPFDYHATGKEMFLGFLKGLGLVAGIFAVYMILSWSGTLILRLIKLSGVFGSATVIVSVIAALPVVIYWSALIIYGLPFVLLGKWRFMLSRSSWCSVRFANSGDPKALRSILVKGILLSVVTFGLYSLVLQNKLQKFFADHSRFGTLKFAYDGTDKEYFWLNLKGILLSVVTIGIYSFWYMAAVNRFIFSHTSLNGRRLSNTMTGGGLFGLTITNILIIIGTVGFGFSIATNRMYSYFYENLFIDGKAEYFETAAGTQDTGASALAIGIEEAANVVDAVSGIF
jgi:uncharacterized membrane protein YjgN (DUF898 family)